jgi:hypothetical protein
MPKFANDSNVSDDVTALKGLFRDNNVPNIRAAKIQGTFIYSNNLPKPKVKAKARARNKNKFIYQLIY